MDLLYNLPEMFQDIMFFYETLTAEGMNLTHAQRYLNRATNESLISKASKRRVEQWEEAIGLKSNGDLSQRKMFLKSLLRGQGKLNEEAVKLIVSAFTGNNCVVKFENSTLRVEIISPEPGEVFLYEDVIKALRPRVPAHIALDVVKCYMTWKDVKEKFATWGAAKNETWETFKAVLP